MARGNQRDVDRKRAQQRAKKGSKDSKGGDPRARQERDAQAMREKQARKAAEKAAQAGDEKKEAK
eukprot:CAMPEP_0113935392 /NCGR_PEP_ID=MMETSP1339-20121228/2549_1 /TAXON_ID=94617 /ORGANISM="Fibrocapsa japonica" /LENGTH=64 /DNA_ID=CAMNT_0000937533 /DNA_START=148 /DNA_END=342 /DNA_ORIENTATION=+ /assembly_acc=CAM_ASM_000762